MLTQILLWCSLASAFKLPWETNHFYQTNQKIDLLVNTVSSPLVEEPLFYYNLPFICPYSDNAKPVHLSIGEILNGDRFWQSDYKLNFEVDKPCMRICDRKISNKRTIQSAIDLIKKDYMVEWVIDGIPGATTLIQDDEEGKPKKFYVKGFPLGFVENDVAYIYNHVMMVIRWHKEFDDPNRKTIVGFEIYPKSVSDFHCPGASKNYQNFPLDITQDETLIPFTYSVYWREETQVNFKSRWKLYIDPTVQTTDGKIHWIAIINSLVIISLLTIVLAIVIIRTIYSKPANIESEKDGWRSLSNEIFVQPVYLNLLCILSGSGVQLIFTIVGLAILLLFGFNNRDTATSTLIITLFIIGGFFSGFSSIQQFKIFSSDPLTNKKAILISTFSATSLMTLALIATIIPNFIVYSKDSQGFINFSTLILIFGSYILFQIPISIFGGLISKNIDYLGLILRSRYPQTVKSVPQSSNLKPLKKQPLYNRWPFNYIIFGAFPFCIVFVELLFVYKTVWINRGSSNFLYGFILFSAILLLIVTVENGIISTFLRLNHNDYFHWQWKTMLITGGSMLLYLQSYSFYYLAFKMKMIDLGSPLLYIVYATTLNVAIAVACGSIGLWSGTVFAYKLYCQHKKD